MSYLVSSQPLSGIHEIGKYEKTLQSIYNLLRTIYNNSETESHSIIHKNTNARTPSVRDDMQPNLSSHHGIIAAT